MIHQRFLGIRSGLTGTTLILFPHWTCVGSLVGAGAGRVLRLRHPWGSEAGEIGEPLGVVRRVRFGDYPTTIWTTTGKRIHLGRHLSTVDGAMSILQYLSNRNDPRLRLEEYARLPEPRVVRDMGFMSWSRGEYVEGIEAGVGIGRVWARAGSAGASA